MTDSRVILKFDGSGTIVTGCKDDRVTRIVIPKSVTKIGNEAFRDCTDLTYVEIPNSVTSIGKGAFNGCTGLKSIEIPNSVTSIEYQAFCKCTSLTSIDIPNSVTNIETRVFIGCYSLCELHIRNEFPEEMEVADEAFDDLGECTLYIPIGTGYAYRHHPAFEGKFKEVIIEK